jgi:hypothetical protein
MISVIQVYNTVRDIANKDQKGFVTPEMFNSLLPAAQSNIFTKIYDYATQAKALRRSGADLGGEDSVYLRAKNYLSDYVETDKLDSINETTYYDDSKVYSKPQNCNRIISIFTDTNISVDLVYNTEKMSRIVNSNLSAPTDDFPIALISDRIEIFPDSFAGDIHVNYYRTPASRYEVKVRSTDQGTIDPRRQPFYAASAISGGITVPNASNCRAFDLPYEFYGEVVSEICKMIGISLRDTFLTQYGAAPQV